ncbi:MAG: lipocalin family protein [Bacteroidales bacterium]|nr:lipocalin family protein [Bacteroidales bacterium]
MKAFKYLTVLFVLIIVSSCSISKKIEKSIIGKWQITSLESTGDNKASDSYKDAIIGLLSGSYIEFKNNKSYELSLAGKKITGIWSISEDGNKILSDDKNNYFEIINKSDSKMTLKSFRKAKRIIMVLSRI